MGRAPLGAMLGLWVGSSPGACGSRSMEDVAVVLGVEVGVYDGVASGRPSTNTASFAEWHGCRVRGPCASCGEQADLVFVARAEPRRQHYAVRSVTVGGKAKLTDESLKELEVHGALDRDLKDRSEVRVVGPGPFGTELTGTDLAQIAVRCPKVLRTGDEVHFAEGRKLYVLRKSVCAVEKGLEGVARLAPALRGWGAGRSE